MSDRRAHGQTGLAVNNSAPGFPNQRVYNDENAMDILLAGGGFTTLPRANPTPADCTIVVGRPAGDCRLDLPVHRHDDGVLRADRQPMVHHG